MSNVTNRPYPRWIDIEARAQYDKYGIDDADGMRTIVEGIRYRAFMRDIEPALEIRRSIFALAMPSITVFRTGQVDYDYHWTKEQQDALKLADEMVNAVRQLYGYSSEVQA